MSATDTERIERLEAQVAALKTLLSAFIYDYNWHHHGYDYSGDSDSYQRDDTTGEPEPKISSAGLKGLFDEE